MDGTASLIYLLAAQQASAKKAAMPVKINNLKLEHQHGAIVRAMPVGSKVVSLVFTADEFGEGLPLITKTLKQQKVAAGFFFTGRFYRNKLNQKNIQQLQKDAHYLGPHSDAHLLYCDWKQRDSLLISYQQFSDDLNNNLSAMEHAGVATQQVHCFIPPYEWWNDSVATWANWRGMQLCSFTPGTFTNADYTWPEMGKAYRSSNELLNKLKTLAHNTNQFNGSILLVHAGTDPRRKDKLYKHLTEIIQLLKKQGYTFKRIDELVK
jgi:peptidoglycan/xylan/chitin deacetylase (PgdA/CDA1 family)